MVDYQRILFTQTDFLKQLQTILNLNLHIEIDIHPKNLMS